jgi:hypothetical protein
MLNVRRLDFLRMWEAYVKLPCSQVWKRNLFVVTWVEFDTCQVLLQAIIGLKLIFHSSKINLLGLNQFFQVNAAIAVLKSVWGI